MGKEKDELSLMLEYGDTKSNTKEEPMHHWWQMYHFFKMEGYYGLNIEDTEDLSIY